MHAFNLLSSLLSKALSREGVANAEALARALAKAGSFAERPNPQAQSALPASQ